ncbi:MAG TPA: two-component sensor histidine kinase, partial [Xylella sp.]
MAISKSRLLLRLWEMNGYQPRSLQARQLLAASFSLVAFLALAGYALNAA